MERCKENDCFVRLQKGKLISGGENLYLSAKVSPDSEEETTYKLTTSHFAKLRKSSQNDQPLRHYTIWQFLLIIQKLGGGLSF